MRCTIFGFENLPRLVAKVENDTFFQGTKLYLENIKCHIQKNYNNIRNVVPVACEVENHLR